MKTIGIIIKNARVAKSFSLGHVEGITKIKSGFINSIEKESWEDLPSFPTVLGFVKSLATSLEIDPVMAVVVLKRDYPPQKLRISPKPDVTKKFIWSPKLTFAVGVTVVVFVLIGYLGFQFFHFRSAPKLKVDSPKQSQVVNGNSVVVFGSTDSDAKILVNNQPIIVSDDGKFSVSLDVSRETKEIIVTASARSGKMTTVIRRITVTNN